MRYFFYNVGLWIRDSRRTGYLRPILLTAGATAAFILLFRIAEHRLFPGLTLWQSRISSMLFSGALAGLMAYVVLRLYRQLAQETIDELTERLRLSEELLGERNLIKSLMETAVDRIYFKDLDGRYLRASASVATAFGVPAASDVMGRSDQDFFAEEYARHLRQDEQEVIRSGQPIINRSYREVRADGRETWASITLVPLRDRHGHVIGTLGVARDITEARLREQRFQQMSRALEQSPNMVLITDRNGVIDYINPTFTAVTGYTEEEVRGQNPRLLNSGCNEPEVYRQLWDTIGAGREWRGELLNRKKNGDFYWARLVISPIREEGGSLTHFVAVTEDITQARQAADALEKEAARRRELERIITISPAVAFLWRAAPGWPVEYVSDNVRRWGYTPEDLTSGRVPFSSLIHGEDMARVSAEVETFTREGRHEFVQEYRLLDRSGGVHWVEDRTWLRHDAGGTLTHYQGVVIDITERRRAEMALLESERNLAEAQRIARLGNWVLEWPTRQMKWSEETFRISGLEPAREAPDFETYVQTLLPEDRPVLEKALQDSVRLGKPFNLEVRHAVPGGLNYIAVKGQPVSRDGQVVRLFGTLLDITERKRAELAQQALTEGLRTVLQLADELIVCPSEDALYLRAVELARQRLGLERCGIMIRLEADMAGTYGTDMDGQTTTEHAHRIPLNDIWRERLRLRETQEQRWTVVEEPYGVWKEGRFQLGGAGWIGITPIQSSMQGAIGVFCNDTAITGAPLDPIKQEVLAVYCSLLGNMVARKRAEEEQVKSLQHQREFMERTDRLNSLGLLAAGMAHEINNPLQGMVSHLHAVQRSLPETFAARSSLMMVERGIDTIAMLVRKLLSLSTTDQGGEMADAGEAMDFVTQLLDAQFRRARVRMVREAAAQSAVLAMPRRELIQVLLNLMINARDAMSGGGTLTLGCRNDGEYGFLTIADTGAGIAPEILDRIFTPFFTTKGTKGTGLGLSVAESLVRSCGGVIQVKSKLGAGTTFTVQIPLARKERV
jgi:PAS domain S-box-containing protein